MRRSFVRGVTLLGVLVAGSCSDDGTGPDLRNLRWSAVGTGMEHTCAVTDAGEVFCWGLNNWGQVGASLQSGQFMTRPRPVPDASGYATVRGGDEFTCGLRTNGEAYCWGWNGWLQLGDPAYPDQVSTRPRAVFGEHRFEYLDLGSWHACALDGSDVLRCWGRGSAGQIGHSGTSDRAFPTRPSGDLSFAAIATGEQHTCGLTESGATYCWGSGPLGQLGIETPSQVCEAAHGDRCEVEPTLLEGAPAFVAIAAGALHTCALTAEGEAHCWGSGAVGQLGDGTEGNLDYFRAEPGPVAGEYRFSKLRAGGAMTCGLTVDDGTVVCWGYNVDGQLGRGNRDPGLTPAPVADGLRAIALDVGAWHACAVTAEDELWCWGRNDRGEVGDGTRNRRTAPYRIGS